MTKCLLVLIGLFFVVSGHSQDVLGDWKTVDDDTGEEKSIVRIYKENNKIYGEIIELLKPENVDALCDKCEGDDYNQPVKGLQIIKGLTKVDQYYKNGNILDPENGKTYQCKIWLDPKNNNQLIVRGYIAFFYRTQYWKRIQS